RTFWRERGVRDNNVCLLKQVDAFRAAKVSVTFEWFNADFLGVRNQVPVLVSLVLKVHSLFSVILAEQIRLLALITSGYEFFELQLLEVVAEVMEEIADPWIIAVEIDNFPFEVLLIVAHLVLNVASCV
ncbi:hypothetical protein, partial [Glutamicibacter sp. BW77]|uniref:hypothetical protein n=1 Tax=Glutamicibacter sp. BW77 TaxID=2024402 RepID=UPI001F0A92B4